jgi:hypothetical protein
VRKRDPADGEGLWVCGEKRNDEPTTERFNLRERKYLESKEVLPSATTTPERLELIE